MKVNINEITAGLQQASRAPSSHNCQPWASVVLDNNHHRQAFCQANQLPFSDDTTIIIFCVHTDRILTTLAHHEVEMQLSIGAYIEALITSLKANIHPEIIWVLEEKELSITPIEDWPTHCKPVLALSLKNDLAQHRKTEYANYLSSRHTHRLQYENKPITAEQQHLLTSTRAHLDQDNQAGLSTEIITDPKAIKKFGQFISDHAAIEFTHRAAWQETYQYMRWTQNDADTHGDGFMLSQVLGPIANWKSQLYKIAMSPTVMQCLNKVKFASTLAKDLGKQYANSSALFVLSFDSEQPNTKTQLIAGMHLLAFWLRCESLNLSLWPASITLQHDNSRHQLQSALNLKNRAFFIGKMGEAIDRQNISIRHSDALNAVTIL